MLKYLLWQQAAFLFPFYVFERLSNSSSRGDDRTCRSWHSPALFVLDAILEVRAMERVRRDPQVNIYAPATSSHLLYLSPVEGR